VLQYSLAALHPPFPVFKTRLKCHLPWHSGLISAELSPVASNSSIPKSPPGNAPATPAP
jgi:hypothetical protein